MHRADTAAAVIAWTHHERFDGTGYPRGLAEDAIPLPGRIAAVADAFDAITTHRPHSTARPVAIAAEMLRAERGLQFDPAVLDALLGALEGAARLRGKSKKLRASSTLLRMFCRHHRAIRWCRIW